MRHHITFTILSALLAVACSNDDGSGGTPGPVGPEPVNYTSGTADFSKYVAVGNSLTAGYSDNALFVNGQTASFPNMLATQFALAGGGNFTIPFMADNLGGATLGGQKVFGNRLYLDFSSGSPMPTEVAGSGTTEISNVLSGPFNNMGVPGAKSFHLVAPGYGNVAGVVPGAANPYFVRFASSPNATVLGDAVAQNPSFFTLWIGSNDFLGYAINGGDGTDQTGNFDPTTYGSTDITDPNVYANVLNGILQALTANGAKGVIANLPDASVLPYFTTVPFAPLDPTNPDFGPQIPTLNATFAQLNAVFAALEVPERSITFSTTGASALVIQDETLPNLSTQITNVMIMGGADPGTATVMGMLYGQARQANENDQVVFPSQAVIGKVNTEAMTNLINLGVPAEMAGQLSVEGITLPMEDKWILLPSEQAAVKTAHDAYNQTIAALAAQYNLPMVDANAYLQTVATTGITLADGSKITATYGTGGGFSLDGIHPSPRGYALIANLFTDTINTEFGSNLPGVNPLDYTGLYIN